MELADKTREQAKNVHLGFLVEHHENGGVLILLPFSTRLFLSKLNVLITQI